MSFNFLSQLMGLCSIPWSWAILDIPSILLKALFRLVLRLHIHLSQRKDMADWPSLYPTTVPNLCPYRHALQLHKLFWEPRIPVRVPCCSVPKQWDGSRERWMYDIDVYCTCHFVIRFLHPYTYTQESIPMIFTGPGGYLKFIEPLLQM